MRMLDAGHQPGKGSQPWNGGAPGVNMQPVPSTAEHAVATMPQSFTQNPYRLLGLLFFMTANQQII